MSEPMSKSDIEDVLSSIRRLVSEDLRPSTQAKTAVAASKLILTPAFRVVEDDLPESAALPETAPSDSLLPQSPTDDAAEVVAAQDAPLAASPAEPAPPEAVTADSPVCADATAMRDQQSEMTLEPQQDAEPDMDKGSDLQLILQRLAAQGLPGDEFLDFVESPKPAPKLAPTPAAQSLEALVTSVGLGVDDRGWAEDGEADLGTPTADAWHSEDWADDHDAVETVVYMDEVEEAEVLQSVTGQEQRLSSGWSETGEWADAGQWMGAVAALAAAGPAFASPDPDAAEAAARAEIEAARLADLAAASAASANSASMFDDEETGFDAEALRELVREIIREELQGSLGERITRNVRKLVRVEINRTLAAREFD